MMSRAAVSLVACCFAACAGSSSNDGGVDTTDTMADTVVDAETIEDEVDVLPAIVPASDYCEHMAEALCGFYVRCGRMAVTDLDACRPVFIETCNARYEPLWAELEARGVVALSGPGLLACAEHLGTVACEQQIFDLDGGC